MAEPRPAPVILLLTCKFPFSHFLTLFCPHCPAGLRQPIACPPSCGQGAGSPQAAMLLSDRPQHPITLRNRRLFTLLAPSDSSCKSGGTMTSGWINLSRFA